MLRSIDGVRNRSKRRPQGPPRTIQEAAEAFIAHVEEMEAGLERALQKGAFDVRYVGDLDKLVPVVERAFDHAISAVDSVVKLWGLFYRVEKDRGREMGISQTVLWRSQTE